MNSTAGVIVELLAVLLALVCCIVHVHTNVRAYDDLFDVLVFGQAMREGRPFDLVREEFIGVDDDGQLIENPDLRGNGAVDIELYNARRGRRRYREQPGDLAEVIERIRVRVMDEATDRQLRIESDAAHLLERSLEALP